MGSFYAGTARWSHRAEPRQSSSCQIYCLSGTLVLRPKGPEADKRRYNDVLVLTRCSLVNAKCSRTRRFYNLNLLTWQL